MGIFDLLRAFLKETAPDRWIVSVNGVRKGPVVRTSSKLEGGTINLDFAYKDGETEHNLKGTMALADAGKPGGDDQFTFDGKDVLHDDVVLSSRVVFPSGPVLLVEFKFEVDGKAYRIRFDGRVFF